MLFDPFSARSLHLSNRMVMARQCGGASRGTGTVPGAVVVGCGSAPMNAPDMDTFYVPGAKGYTDYPALAA